MMVAGGILAIPVLALGAFVLALAIDERLWSRS